ncbi:ester cyclase [Sandaracinus amylolyticus]|uniref:ester cyclase n=1 Tax=Sandaracinus amylolyticus TaxID=927083 RepID=UPI001F2ACD03|nr:ester cyclase [Sandaracinus amylolyticus]UJR84349.1 Hypothetical protein I5071_64280 [Sandaracinus amylolyticus]
MSQKPQDIVRALLEDTYSKGKVELVSQLCADEFVAHDPLMGRMDRKGFEEQVKMYRRAFPDAKMEVVEQICSGDRVITKWRASGTHQAELMGIPATNKRAQVEGVSIDRIVNGKVVESYAQWDAMGLMRQLGVMPASIQMRPNGGGAKAPPPPQARR